MSEPLPEHLDECRPEGGCSAPNLWWFGDSHPEGDRGASCREHLPEAVDWKCAFPEDLRALLRSSPWMAGQREWCRITEEMFAETAVEPFVQVVARLGPWGLWTATDGERRCWGQTPGQAMARVLEVRSE